MTANNCVTHHHACDCREARIRELIGAQRALWIAEGEHPDEYAAAKDRHRKAFLAVEAMYAAENSLRSEKKQ